MASLKGILFNQYANEGMNRLVEELQAKYNPKRGRRFNHNNITYEISRPSLKNNSIEFEISSKIPQDELKNPDQMQAYFQGIKKVISKEKKKPVSIDMENIVWDSKKETEKQRDYVKLVYQYPLGELIDDDGVQKKHQQILQGKTKESIPEIPSAFTQQGKLVLQMVGETTKNLGLEHVNQLINANKQVRSQLGK